MRILTGLAVLAMLFALGCSSPNAPDTNAEIEAFFAGVNPTLTGIVGDYSYTGPDGTYESGKLMRNDDGSLVMIPDRGSAGCVNCFFTVNINYYDYAYITTTGLPVYYIGSTMRYEVDLQYKETIDMCDYPTSYAKLYAEQRYYPSLNPLPGDWQEVWDETTTPQACFPPAPCPGCSPPVYTDWLAEDTYYIPGSAVPGNDVTLISIDWLIGGGTYQFNVLFGLCGYWDP